MSVIRSSVAFLLVVCALLGDSTTATVFGDDESPLPKGAKEIAGTAEVLRSVPKAFATLKHVDVARRRVTLLIEGESLPKTWDLVADAEIKRAGWWGRLDQLRTGDRHWVWFKPGRKGDPLAVLMIADELSEQDIHGPGVKLTNVDDTSVTIKPRHGPERKLLTEGAEIRCFPIQPHGRQLFAHAPEVPDQDGSRPGDHGQLGPVGAEGGRERVDWLER